jgi:nitric-oxide synthase
VDVDSAQAQRAGVGAGEAASALLEAGNESLGPGQPALAADRLAADGALLDTSELLAEAERFLTLFHAEDPAAGPLAERMQQVRDEVAAQGTYRHTPAELAFAARVAWRNSSRCIGRLYWRTLRIRDRREVSGAQQIADECVSHLREATNFGRIRPVITIFAPDAPGRPGPRILNSQLISYAGYLDDSTVIGDPAHLDITRLAHELGWRPIDSPGRFDLLPLIIQSPGLPPARFDLPRDAVLEVPLRHPDLDWFRELRLRWYAVPVISDMYLEAGGIRYPAAPFNGWYMCTEIGSRDLGDETRYNQLPEIAARMGLSTESPRTLWKDRAVTELNAAVLYSYEMSGVKISDHHSESELFLAHIDKEQQHGRSCPADWSWIVPPAAGSTTAVFHRTFEDFDASPNFYRHAG